MATSTTKLKARYGFENPFVVDPLVRRTRRYLNRHGSRLLDIGCGEGADSAFYARHGYRVTSIDKNAAYLERFRAYRHDEGLSNIKILEIDALDYGYPKNRYDVISCILVLCCMKRSEFERMLPRMKRTVKRGGILAVSSRNFLDPELHDYCSTEKMIEPNTFRKKEDCCKFVYFIEQGRLREVFSDFDVLYYYEGFTPCKYNEHPKHGD